MSKRIGGLRRKARYKLKKERRQRGKISVSRFMQSFKAGQKVYLAIEPSLHRGDYHTKFVGKIGTVKGSRGKCFEVAVRDGGKEKMLIIHPAHLKSTGD